MCLQWPPISSNDLNDLKWFQHCSCLGHLTYWALDYYSVPCPKLAWSPCTYLGHQPAPQMVVVDIQTIVAISRIIYAHVFVSQGQSLIFKQQFRWLKKSKNKLKKVVYTLLICKNMFNVKMRPTWDKEDENNALGFDVWYNHAWMEEAVHTPLNNFWHLSCFSTRSQKLDILVQQ